MSVSGETRDAFSARTIDVPKIEKDLTQEIINLSREKYARPRVDVEKDLKAWDEKALEEGGEDIALEAGEEDFTAPLV